MSAVAILIAETGIMYLLETIEADHPIGIWLEVLVDTAALSCIVMPILYFVLYRPLSSHIGALRRAEQDLRRAGDDLEVRVAERTEELSEANRLLRREAQERKNALEELHYSEQKYSTLVENSPTGIFIQRGGRFVFTNQLLADMLGYTRQELLAMNPDQIVHPEDWPWVREIMEKRMRGEAAPEEYETRAMTRDGEIRWALLRAVRVEYRGGRSTLANVLDVTPRKQAEAALAESEENLRKLSARLMKVQEEERANIARELHDGVGQSLTAIKFAIESALRDPECAACPLGDVVPRMQDLITEVRQISLGLRPSILDDLGLVRTLRWQCKEFEGLCPDTEVEVNCEVDDAEVPDALKIVMFRMVQEALTNVAKHSGAGRVVVGLENSDGALILSVKDDGRGLPPRPPGQDRTGEGFGINSMRERATLAGGRFSLHSEPGTGTEVRAVWPQDAAGATG